MVRFRARGRAWLLLCAGLALHVADEAAHDFLSVYNPSVLAIRRAAPWLPVPTFTFGVWLGGLIVAVVALSLLAPWIARGGRWAVFACYAFGGLMTANALGHLAGSVYSGRCMPGVYSSPVLLGAALWLLLAARERPRAI